MYHFVDTTMVSHVRLSGAILVQISRRRARASARQVAEIEFKSRKAISRVTVLRYKAI